MADTGSVGSKRKSSSEDSVHHQGDVPPTSKGLAAAGEISAADPVVQAGQQSGVAKIEALHRVFGKGALSVWWLYASIAALSYAYSLDQSTTSNYGPLATSAFGEHAIIGTVTTAEAIITACGKPFIAKIADVTSRPTAYAVVLGFYLLGYIVIASARNVAAAVVGMVLYTVGHTGLDLVTDIIIADLSPLKWRGLMTSLASAPFIVNAFVSAQIVNGVLDHAGWRWGYGMFAIIMPTVMTPAIVILFWADVKAKRAGTLSFAASPAERRRHEELLNEKGSSGIDRLQADGRQKLTFVEIVKDFAIKIDIGGLILICFAFSLILLPITLAKTAHGGWKNPSIGAMMGVGVVCLFLFVIYERYGTSHPLMPRRILMNKTFLCAVGIDVFYFMSGTLRSTYLSSYTYIVKDFSNRNWVYFGNTQSLALCIFGLLAGVILRYSHRYKYLQISGLCIRIVGMGLTVHARAERSSMAELVWTQILIGMGGAFSVVGSRVASQASVPHQDLASVIALLSLWTQLGSAIGGAIASGIWTNTMLNNMKKDLTGVEPALIKKLYGSLLAVRAYPRGTLIREGVTRAYEKTILPMLALALGLSFLPLICGLLMTNYYLGDTQNAVDGTAIDGTRIIPEEELDPQHAPSRRVMA